MLLGPFCSQLGEKDEHPSQTLGFSSSSQGEDQVVSCQAGLEVTGC